MAPDVFFKCGMRRLCCTTCERGTRAFSAWPRSPMRETCRGKDGTGGDVLGCFRASRNWQKRRCEEPWMRRTKSAMARCMFFGLGPVAGDAFDVCISSSLPKVGRGPVPATSFHRYIQWARQGVRIMLAPQHVHSKLDKKSGCLRLSRFGEEKRNCFFTVWGPKEHRVWTSAWPHWTTKGPFLEQTALPAHVNSPYDDLNPGVGSIHAMPCLCEQPSEALWGV